jgi:hypothetical protein
MELKEVSLTTINLGLEKLRVQDHKFDIFGTRKHLFISTPVSLNEVESFESHYSLKVPNEYRRFLLEVGFGAGPYYGIFNPRGIESEILEFGDFCFEEEAEALIKSALSSEFPISISDAHEIVHKINNRVELPHFIGDFPFTGCIPMCFQGCQYWTVLVVAGELRGSVWDVEVSSSDDCRWLPAKRPPGIARNGYKSVGFSDLLPIPSFNMWFDAWLYQCDADLAGLDTNSPGGSVGRRFLSWLRDGRAKR